MNLEPDHEKQMAVVVMGLILLVALVAMVRLSKYFT
jgi:hypothetical protein